MNKFFKSLFRLGIVCLSVWTVSCGGCSSDDCCKNCDGFKALSYKKKSAPTADHDAEKYDCQEVENLAYGGNDHQTFDFYKPMVDTPQKRPLIVVLHPGGFVLGSKDDLITTQLSRDFCRRGFKVAAVNYRLLGWRTDLRALVSRTYTRGKIMESVNDVRQAIQHLNDRSDELGIDKDNIFVVGFSAGAIIANHLVFSDEQEVTDYLNEHGSVFTKKKKSKNHILPQENPAPTSTPAMPASPASIPTMAKLKGVIALGGGLMSPEHADDKDVMQTPLLLIHGTKDKMVPNGTGRPFDLIVEDQKLDFPGLYLKLGVIYGGKDTAKAREITLQRGILIPRQWMSALRNALTSEMCGSQSIFQKIHKSLPIQYIQIKGAPHNFMTNEQGIFNQTYIDVRKEMMKFLKKRQFLNNFNLK